jgi:hypothetical protein
MSASTKLLRLRQIIGQVAVTDELAKINRELAVSNRKLPKENQTAIKGPKYAQPCIQPLVPVCASAWWQGVKDGRYPKPIKLSPRVTAWREDEVLALIGSK